VPAITSRRTATAEPTSTPRALLRFTVTGDRTSRLVTTTTLLLAAAFLAGCSTSIKIGGSDTVDPARITDAIRRQLQVPDGQLGSVACPRGVKLAEGVTFTCTADVEGALLPITVTLSHVDTDTGSFDYNFKLAKALIDTDNVVEEIDSKLPVQASVACGPPHLRVVEVGGTIECTVSEGSKQEVVRAVVDDLDGTVHFEPPLARREAATGRLGDKLTVYDEFGDAILEFTVTRVKFSTGDEFEQPQRGLYMGAYVKAHALADDQYISGIHALVRDHLYEEAITGSLAFDPPLEAVTLSTRASGRPAGSCSTSQLGTASSCCATWTSTRSGSGSTEVGAAGETSGR